MAKDHTKFVVLEARKGDEWLVRNSRISYNDKVAFDLDKGLAMAEAQMQGWQKHEPQTAFRVRVLSYEQFRDLNVAA